MVKLEQAAESITQLELQIGCLIVIGKIGGNLPDLVLQFSIR